MSSQGTITASCLLATVLFACGGSDEQACLDYIAGLRAGIADCDAALRQELEDKLQFVSCDGASVRDEVSLRDECLPYMESATCAQFRSRPIDACVDQVTLRCPEELAGSPRCRLYEE